MFPQQVPQFPRRDIQYDDSLQDTRKDSFMCPKCGRAYVHRRSLMRHVKLECGKEPSFKCPYCPKKSKQKENMKQHIILVHLKPVSSRREDPGHC